MNRCCENCGWSEIVGSPIMCNYNGHRTWRDEYCPAWKPKKKETNMVEVVRCKDCRHYFNGCCYSRVSNRINFTVEVPDDWFCADGERKEGR